ncbi:hypothetical protein CSB45_08875 [candidate division KSB3 bacterium]|uniref:Uncharacterized protein n=1 Tax=candidate division KSB3 bacterium TaxID=2044937 RepID=A0A2G6E512_9BACT|nr:MAG: hypothetical protein CSB45_08875 [candidate division KSB3 bacterium]PIE29666.1 MAG: hypothetical protein CSA57_07555 [candidate division KSB3 bacterium]
MTLSDRLTERAGIVVHYAGGSAAICFGGVVSLFSLIGWALFGMSLPQGIILSAFGIVPVGGGL